MYDYDYEDMYVECEYAAPIVLAAKHTDVVDAVYTLMEQFYNSAFAINADQIRGTFAYLCDTLGMEKGMLEDPEGLCVVHWREKWTQKNKMIYSI